MKYKLLVSDFDGTLTDSRGNVPKENIDAIRAFCKAGGIFTLSTGRMRQSIEKKLGTLGLSGQSIPLISYQGALITDIATGERLHSVPMDPSVVRRILRYCKAEGLHCQIYSFDALYVNEYSGKARAYAEYVNVVECTYAVGELESYLDSHPELPISKVLIIDEPENIEESERRINAHFAGEAVFSRAAGALTECVSPRAGKGAAVRWLAEFKGIPIEAVAAIGDAGNDASMIAAAGLGIAMAGAPDSLKRIAGYVTDGCDEGGFKKAVYLMIKDKR
ncbi:MAG: Cof-type HAD-IIB family hydrolase [Firmicutes bacterium]|nr:Cof-type HAD-IIB family hydrolase [Bacillota bacterium]